MAPRRSLNIAGCAGRWRQNEAAVAGSITNRTRDRGPTKVFPPVYSQSIFLAAEPWKVNSHFMPTLSFFRLAFLPPMETLVRRPLTLSLPFLPPPLYETRRPLRLILVIVPLTVSMGMTTLVILIFPVFSAASLAASTMSLGEA